MGEQSRFQAFEHAGLLARAAPFLGAMWLAIMAFPLPPEVETSPVLVAAVIGGPRKEAAAALDGLADQGAARAREAGGYILWTAV